MPLLSLSLLLLTLATLLLLLTPTTEALPAHPADATPTAACPTSDQTIWLSTEFAVVTDNLNTCGLESLGDEDAARTCLRQHSSLSDSCIECQVDLIVCTSHSCAGSCINGGQTNDKCVTCTQTNCNPGFVTCTGFDFPDCPACATAPPKTGSSDTIIPGLSQGGSIGVIVGGVIAFLLICGLLWYAGACHDPDANVRVSIGNHQLSPPQGSFTNYNNGSGILMQPPPPAAYMSGYPASPQMGGGHYLAQGNMAMSPYQPQGPRGNIMDDI